MNKFLDWFYDTFTEPLELDEHRSWESYWAFALSLLQDDIGAWGGRVGADSIKSYLFVSWMNGVDYHTAICRLRNKMKLED